MQHQPVFAIVGCGLIGSRRAATVAKGSLKLVCDLDFEKAQALAKFYDAREVSRPEEIIADPEIDAVIVSAPNAALAPVTLAAVRADKHVLVEKPGAIALEQLAEIESVAAATGSLVRIGYNHRFHPAFLKVRELVATEELGGSYGLERLTYYQMLPEMGPPDRIIYEFPRGDDSWAIELNEFIEDIRLGRTPSPGLAEGKRTLEIVEQIYQKSGYR